MTPPSPTTPLPSGYELLSPDFLREYGAVKGMLFWDKFNTTQGPLWVATGHAEREQMDESHLGLPHCAPIGTTAMLSTPLPEVRCKSAKGFCMDQDDHAIDCPCHPRNRVLPQQLAGLPEKPESLLWADMLAKRWSPMNLDWKFFKESVSLDPVFAYAIKQHEMDAIEAGKEKAPLPATGYANEEEIRRLAQIPQGVSLWDGVRNLAEQNERLKERIRELNNDDGNAAPVTAAPEKSDPSQASGPTDGEKGVFDALLRLYRNDYLPPELAIGDDCPCDHGIMDGVPCKTCDEAAVALYIADQEKKHPLKTDWLE